MQPLDACCLSLQNSPDRTLVEDPLRGLLRAEARGIKPPSNVSETVAHRCPKFFVAVEEELILRRANLVAVPTHGSARVEDHK